MLWDRARGQNLGHLKKCLFQVLFRNHLMLIPDKQLIRKHSYLITWYHAVLALTPLRLQTFGCMPGNGARGSKSKTSQIFFSFTFFLVWNYLYLNHYTPRKLCLWEGILFSHCPNVRPTDCVSVTFCFLNILKNYRWNFVKFCKHIYIYKANTTNKKLRARGQYYLSYFPL